MNIYQPSFGLVFGYLENIDKQSDVAKANNLEKKLSISLDTYNPEIGVMYFDSNMFCKLIQQLISFFEYDSLKIEYDDGTIRIENNFDETIEKILKYSENKIDEDDDNIMDKIFFYKNEILALYIEYSNAFIATGGPFPYHDTHNFDLYANNFNEIEIRKRLMRCSVENNFDLRSIYIGNHKPNETLIHKLGKIF